MNLKNTFQLLVNQMIITIFWLIVVSTKVFAQDSNLSGLYQGMADAAPYGKIPVSAEIYEKDNGFSGKLITPLGNLAIVEGARSDLALSLKFDLTGTDLLYEAVRQSDSSFRGNLTSPTLKGTLELKRISDAPDYSLKYVQGKEKWREDLRFLAEEIANKHKNAFHRTTKEEFEEAVAQLDKKIPELDDEQILLGMAHIAAMIGDGHTSFAWNWEYERLPIRFFWFGKELRVTKVSRDYPRLNGAKILKINGTKVEELFERSRDYIAQGESPLFVLDESQYLFRFPAFLKTVGKTKTASSSVATIEAVDLSGRIFKQNVKAVAANAKIDYLDPFKSAPLYLQNENEPISFVHLKKENAVYVNFRSYPRSKDFEGFSKKLFGFIDQNNVQKLIIDLRGNGGGNYNLGRQFLVNPIKERKILLQNGNFYVIIGRKTFSAAMVNADDFKKQTGAILVGEPTGARPNNYGEVRTSLLPNSHIPVRYSTEYYKFSDTDVPALMPDIVIKPDWKSYFAGRDDVLNWILKKGW